MAQPQTQTQPKPQAVRSVRQPATTGAYAIRTVPQEVHPGDYVNGRLGVRAGSGQVAAVQVTRLTPPTVPKGYKSLLSEDRAQAKHGVGTAIGKAQMDLVWTETMPRRLIDVTTGRDVTTVYATIRYPYTSTTASSRSYVKANAGSATSRSAKSPAHWL